MNEKMEKSKTKKARQIKLKKPYLSCTWYPMECNAVGCDCGQGPCPEYQKEGFDAPKFRY